MGTWNQLEHPADLAIEGRGDTPEAALAAVAEGLLAQLVSGDPKPGTCELIRVEGLDRPECLVALLNELLYRVNVRRQGLSVVEVVELGETAAALRAVSWPRSPGEAPGTEVKAATYHDLLLAEEPEGCGWRLRVVFDV